MTDASGIGRAYQRAYAILAGRHPCQRIWHFQWSSVASLHAKLRTIAPTITGRILDVGCGDKPYKSWFSAASDYVGVDVDDSAAADQLIEQESPFPFNDGEFDAIVSFEVLEHVENPKHTVNEMFRVVRAGGTVILTIPFLYNEHGAPGDFRRLTRFSAHSILSELSYPAEVTAVETIGGVGSTMSIIGLNWIEVATNRNRATRLLKGVLLPLWLIVSLGINIVGKLFDALDSTESFYHHVYFSFRRLDENAQNAINVSELG